MKIVFVVVGVLFATVVATLAALDNPGYVLIARSPWSAEMSLAVFVPLLLLTFGALYLFFFMAVRVVRIPRDVTRWRRERQVRSARTNLFEGLKQFAEANWTEAEPLLLASMRGSEAPLLAQLAAACVSQGRGNLEKRDEYLALAQQAAPRERLAIGMTQANLQYLAHQFEQALATLSELRAHAPKQKHILSLLAQLYFELRDWTNLADLIETLRDNNAMGAKEIDALELRATKELMMLTLPSGSLDVLKKAWSGVPKPLQRHPTLIAIYARQLVRQEEMNEAEVVLRTILETDWDTALVEIYGRVRSDRAAQQLETVESWLSNYPEEPVLLLAAARIALHNKHEARARGYFEKCVQLRGPVDAYRELGTLLERLGEMDKALACYRRGLDSSLDAHEPPPTRAGVSYLPKARIAR